MSRPKYYWYGIVKKMVMKYPQLKVEKSLQASIYVVAIEKALEETKETENAKEKLEIIQKVLFDKRKTTAGAALDINYSERTAQRWINSFINLCGKNVGF